MVSYVHFCYYLSALFFFSANQVVTRDVAPEMYL